MTDDEVIQSLNEGLQALIDGETVCIRLNSAFTDAQVEECLHLFEEKIGLPIYRVEVPGLLSRSFLASTNARKPSPLE